MKLKKTLLYGFSILSLTCLSTAQDAPKGPPPDGGPPGAPPPGGPRGGPPGGGGDPAGRAAEFVKRLDTNADGKIDKEEFAVMSRKMSDERFGEMDANKDGFVDQEEAGKMAQRQGRPGGGQGSPGMRPEGEGQGGRRGGMGMFDPKEAFKRMDTDGNGSLSEEEYAKGVEKMREMFRGRGGPGGPGVMRPGEGGGPGGPGGPPREGGGFRRPPVEGDGPKAPEPPAAPPEKPKDPA